VKVLLGCLTGMLLVGSTMLFGQTLDHADRSAQAQDPASHIVNQNSHSSHPMVVEVDGAVMNQNFRQLPRGCSQISGDHTFTVSAGRSYAKTEPGMIFGMSQYEFAVNPCSRVTVTFVNEDDVRHQWMVHGLPKYLYPAGMFHIEASGGRTKTGTFIAPSENRSYLVHCDLAQHMEKGMRAQLKVGTGSGDIWGVSGISDSFYRADYLPDYTLELVIASFLGVFGVMLLLKNRAWK